MSFNSPPMIDLDDGRRQLAKDLKFKTWLGDGQLQVIVPNGFKTNMASTPRCIWWLLPRDDVDYLKPSIMHDFLYGQPSCSRFLADALFREAMSQSGAPIWKQFLIFYAVRLFGASYKTK